MEGTGMIGTAWRTGARAIVLLLVAVALSSCRLPPWFNGTREFDGYIPFIESITAPQAVHVGDAVEVVTTFSTALVPGLLDDPYMKWDAARGWKPAVGDNGATTHYITEYDPIGHRPYPSGPPGEMLALTTGFGEEDVGTVTLRFGSTASRERGGTKVRLITQGESPGPFFDCDQPGFEYREVTIQVLP